MVGHAGPGCQHGRVDDLPGLEAAGQCAASLNTARQVRQAGGTDTAARHNRDRQGGLDLIGFAGSAIAVWHGGAAT